MAWLRYALPAAVGIALLAAGATCDEGGENGTEGGAGNGEGGCPADSPPEPLYTVRVTAMRGTLPADTTLRVKWSAGEEPEFVLNDPETHKTLDDGSNLVCDVDADAGGFADLAELRCELWTSGATEIEVTASGYLAHDETLMPKHIDGCDQAVPSEVEIELAIDLDAGTGN